MINPGLHKAVIVIDSSTPLGFLTIGEAVSFFEGHALTKFADPSKILKAVTDLIVDGVEIEGVNYNFYDIDTFVDLFEEDDDDDSDSE